MNSPNYISTFEKEVKRVTGLKRGDITGGWKKLHCQENHDLECIPKTITVLQQQRMRWAGHVPCIR
jgi:hypothetical protein